MLFSIRKKLVSSVLKKCTKQLCLFTNERRFFHFVGYPVEKFFTSSWVNLHIKQRWHFSGTKNRWNSDICLKTWKIFFCILLFPSPFVVHVYCRHMNVFTIIMNFILNVLTGSVHVHFALSFRQNIRQTKKAATKYARDKKYERKFLKSEKL